MVNKLRVVNYIGVSDSFDEAGVRTVNLHTSNNSKYSVWSFLPSQGDSSVKFRWFRVPDATPKVDAVKMLLDRADVQEDVLVRNTLQAWLAGHEPKPKTKTTVTVEITPKGGNETNLAKIKEAVENRKAG